MYIVLYSAEFEVSSVLVCTLSFLILIFHSLNAPAVSTDSSLMDADDGASLMSFSSMVSYWCTVYVTLACTCKVKTLNCPAVLLLEWHHARTKTKPGFNHSLHCSNACQYDVMHLYMRSWSWRWSSFISVWCVGWASSCNLQNLPGRGGSGVCERWGG